MSTGRSLPSKSKEKRKKKKKKKKTQRPGGRKKQKKWRRAMWTKPMCNRTWAFPSKNDAQFFPSVFFSFWKENFLVGLKRKHRGPTIYFPSSPPNPTHSKKKFPFYFLFKVFHPPYFTFKQTYPKWLKVN